MKRSSTPRDRSDTYQMISQKKGHDAGKSTSIQDENGDPFSYKNTMTCAPGLTNENVTVFGSDMNHGQSRRIRFSDPILYIKRTEKIPAIALLEEILQLLKEAAVIIKSPDPGPV